MVMVMFYSGDAMRVVVVVMVIVDGNCNGEWRCWLVAAVAVELELR